MEHLAGVDPVVVLVEEAAVWVVVLVAVLAAVFPLAVLVVASVLLDLWAFLACWVFHPFLVLHRPSSSFDQVE